MGQNRRLRQNPSLRRRPGTKPPKIVIWVVCEGKNTEPKYVEDFARHHGNGCVKIEPIKEAGVPLTLVTKAVELNNDLSKKARKKQANSFDAAFEVWAISDTDEHPKIPEAMQLAESNGITYCISNPCFELWALLHIIVQDAHTHRHDLQRLLREHMPNYDHNKGAIIDYEQIKEDYNTAKERAEWINNRREEEGTPRGNTSTNVYLLLDEIIKNGKS